MSSKKVHEAYMKRCLQLARLGITTAAPNPSVGAILVYEGKIIGEGYTSPYGGNHAEVNCINSVEENNKHLISKSTLYVSLEPCNHYGKTPPCTGLILSNKIPEVIIGLVDNNKIVEGKGIEKLKQNGVKVVSEILPRLCKWQYRVYNNFQTGKRPYIILNWAETQNGFMAPENDAQLWISNNLCKRLTHKLRAENQAILVGKKTALIDNPQLTTRYWRGKSPNRVLIDKKLEIPATYNVYNNTAHTFIFNGIKSEKINTVELVKIDFEKQVLNQILDFLYKQSVLSLIVEGGIKTLQYFIEENLWDEAIIIKSDVYWENGLKAPKVNGKLIHQLRLNKDLIEYYHI